jgi:hypothetical protein
MEYGLLPELWSLVLSFMDFNSVAVNAPQVSKLFNQLSLAAELWKSKCDAERIDFKFKRSAELWKDFYYEANTPQLFPMFGTIEIGISTKRQVRANPGCTLYDQVLDEMHVKNVVCSFGTQSRVNRISHIKPLPKKWLYQGVTLKRTWYDTLIFLRRRFRNFQITVPYQREQARSLYQGTVRTIAKYKNIFYSLSFTFRCAGDERSSKAESIAVDTADTEEENQRWAELYNANAIEPKNYNIPDDALQAYRD